VFTTQNCPYCLKAKGLLQQKGWAFDEINLTAYPEKRCSPQ
jgi:glutaredoxin 3